jgi:hypothetical protein
MPKTDVKSPIEDLQAEISRLQAEIADTETAIATQQSENSQYKESVRLLSTNTAKYVPVGTFPVMDALIKLMQQTSTEEERSRQWQMAQEALKVGEDAVISLQTQLEDLQRQLAIAQEELDWQENFASHAERYRQGFVLAHPGQIRQNRIKLVERDLGEKRQQLVSAENYLMAKDPKPQYIAVSGYTSAAQDVEYLKRAIASLEKDLENLRSEPVKEDAAWEMRFRQYVRARTQIQPELSKLLHMQNQYLETFAKFKEAVAANPRAVEFEAIALKPGRLIEVVSGRIELT